jgi:hypothetical protein
MTQAWAHWHRPWALAPASSLDEASARWAGANELALRLHYPAWCEQHALAPTLDGFEDNTWWRLFGLARGPFDQTLRRVGLTLMYAAHPRSRLMRGAGDDLEVVRWALGRSPFVPGRLARALRDADLPATATSHAGLSLSWCLADSPDLWARLRLRLPPMDLHAVDDPRNARHDDPAMRTCLSALWAGGVRAAQQETRS